MILPGSYADGFAPRDGQPLYPSLWRGCVGAWAPCLGPTGLTLRDWSGFGKHGTLTNMAGDDWVNARGRYALDFDASNDYVSLGTPLVAGSSPRSVTIRAKLNAVASGGINRIMYSCGATASAGTQFEFGQNGSTGGTWYFQGFAANANFSTGDTLEHSHTVTYDGSVLRWWMDGIVLGAATLALNTNATSHAIGYDIVFNSAFFNGYVKDLLIHNRVLSSNEIKLLSSRSGIAYELAPRRRASLVAGFNRRRRLLVGAGS